MAQFIDSVKDKWEQVSPRERRLVILLSMTLVVIVVALIVRSIAGGLADMERRNSEVRKNLLALEEGRIASAAAAPVKGPKRKAVDPGAEPLSLKKFSRSVAKELEIELEDFKSRQENKKNQYTIESGEQRIKTQLDLGKLASFFTALETQEQGRVAITELNLRQNRSDKNVVDVTQLVLSTYFVTPADGAAKKEEEAP